MTWSALEPEAARAAGTPRSLMVVPPQLWTAGAEDAKTLLSTVSLADAFGPGDAPAAARDAGTRSPDHRGRDPGVPGQAAEDGVPAHIRGRRRHADPRIDALNAALVDDPQAPLTPERFIAPLREDLLRAMSLSRTPRRRTAVRGGGGRRRAPTTWPTMDDLFGAVTVLSPGGVYTLASEQSPLLLVARNDLPVGINVRLQVGRAVGDDDHRHRRTSCPRAAAARSGSHRGQRSASWSSISR